jgi:uncharacterized protein YndB with AHSA1/START domain
MTARKKKIPARAIADVTSGTILATVEIAAQPERVFRALTSPDEIVRWWGSEEMYKTISWTPEFRVGGKWRSEGRDAGGDTFAIEGEYLEIAPPRKLVQTWKPDFDAGHETTLTYLLEPTETGTRVTLRHEGFADREQSLKSHAFGWEFVLNWLGDFAAPPAAVTDEKYFFCRLLPPRPTFAMDMNAEERAVMQEHALYWRGMLAAGSALVFGPVGDPKGPWGLGILRAADEAAAHALQAKDPVILSGRGFSYELMPMMQLVTG